jgi:hypothetical protein
LCLFLARSSAGRDLPIQRARLGDWRMRGLTQFSILYNELQIAVARDMDSTQRCWRSEQSADVVTRMEAGRMCDRQCRRRRASGRGQITSRLAEEIGQGIRLKLPRTCIRAILKHLLPRRPCFSLRALPTFEAPAQTLLPAAMCFFAIDLTPY